VVGTATQRATLGQGARALANLQRARSEHAKPVVRAARNNYKEKPEFSLGIIGGQCEARRFLYNEHMVNVKEQFTKKQREEFTKQQLEYFFEMSHPRWGKVIKYSFIRGIATGFGVLVGGTIVVALLLWILSLLGQVPFLNEISESTRDTLDKTN